MARTKGTCVKKTFLFFNTIFWLVGLAILGYVAWVLATLPDIGQFMSGAFIFTYSLLALGILITLIGLFGCIGACAESACCLKVYIGMMTVLLLVDIGIGIAGYVQKDQIFYLVQSLWDESNQDTRNELQQHLNCCGYNNYTDYGTAIPTSCYSDSTKVGTLYTTTCRDAMSNWINSNIPIWVATLCGVAFIQITGLIMACKLHKHVKENMRVSDSFS